MATAKPAPVVVAVAGREVTVSNPEKLYFPEAGISKLDLVQYYLAVAEGALRGAGGRPNVLVRRADGIHGEFFFQKRAPNARPPWIEVVELRFPSGGRAEEVVPRDAAALAWMANLGCLELHPHPVRAEDLELARHSRQRADPTPLVLRPGAARRPRLRPRGGAARPGAGHQQVVEGGAARGLPRLQPERQGPHGRQRLLGAAEARCAGVGAGDLGRARVVPAGGLHPAHHAAALRSVGGSPRRNRRPRVRAGEPARALRPAGGAGAGGRAVAAALSQAGRRAAARAAVAAGLQQAADRDRPLQGQGRGARRPGAVE